MVLAFAGDSTISRFLAIVCLCALSWLVEAQKKERRHPNLDVQYYSKIEKSKFWSNFEPGDPVLPAVINFVLSNAKSQENGYRLGRFGECGYGAGEADEKQGTSHSSGT